VLESPSLVYTAMSRDWPLNPVGLGEFTEPEDRLQLGPVIQVMLEARKAEAIREQDLDTYRFVEAVRGTLLAGAECPDEAEREDEYNVWMEKRYFKTPHDEAASGWTPLRFAVYEGRLDIARQLLSKKADVHAPLAAAALDKGFHCKGSTVLHGACYMIDSPKAVELLLRHRADPCRCDAHGHAPSHLAFYGGRAKNIEIMAKLRPDAFIIPDFLGMQPWQIGVAQGKAEVVRRWCEGHPESVKEAVNYMGQGMCTLAVVDVGDLKTLELAISTGCDINLPNKPRTIAAARCKAFQAACYVTKEPDLFTEGCANAPGATALWTASYLGNAGAVQLLLESRADMEAANCYGRTPLMAAAMRGHRAVAVQLLQARANGLAVDARGVTAFGWAKRRGSHKLAEKITQGIEGIFIRCESEEMVRRRKTRRRSTRRRTKLMTMTLSGRSLSRAGNREDGESPAAAQRSLSRKSKSPCLKVDSLRDTIRRRRSRRRHTTKGRVRLASSATGDSEPLSGADGTSDGEVLQVSFTPAEKA